MIRPILCSLIALFVVMTNLWFAQSQAQLYGQTQQYGGDGSAYRQNAPDNIIIILDASESMNDRLSTGETKFQAAKRVVLDTVQQMPPNVNVGLRVYGQSRGPRGGAFGFMTGGEICRQTQLLVPL